MKKKAQGSPYIEKQEKSFLIFSNIILVICLALTYDCLQRYSQIKQDSSFVSHGVILENMLQISLLVIAYIPLSIILIAKTIALVNQAKVRNWTRTMFLMWGAVITILATTCGIFLILFDEAIRYSATFFGIAAAGIIIPDLVYYYLLTKARKNSVNKE